MNKRTAAGTLIWLVCIMGLFPTVSMGSELTLAIANSTCATMKKAGAIFTNRTNIQLNYLCNASGLLAHGIKEEALGADYFLSASEKWMNDVQEAGRVDAATIKKPWGNKLVVASLPLRDGEIKLHTLADLKRAEVKQIVMGDPNIAPYGMYAKEAMINSGLWQEVQDKLKFNRKISLSIRTLKKLGFSKIGVVAFLYQTNVTGNLLTHFMVPQQLYTRIHYYAAPLKRSAHRAELDQFLSFITSEEANDIFRSAGFAIGQEN